MVFLFFAFHGMAAYNNDSVCQDVYESVVQEERYHVLRDACDLIRAEGLLLGYLESGQREGDSRVLALCFALGNVRREILPALQEPFISVERIRHIAAHLQDLMHVTRKLFSRREAHA